MQRITIIAAFILLIAAGSCGHGRKLMTTIDNHPGVFAQAQALQPAVEWPSGLPVDKAQPWETLDGAGRVVSSINLQSEFIPGVERFTESGLVYDNGEASAFDGGMPGDKYVSWAIYRIPMGAEQPGTIACDANLRLEISGAPSGYYIGVGDYSANTWHWYGPFGVSHVRIGLPPAAYTSALGNLMLAVVAYDGANFDLVGLGVNARDGADTTAPPVPSAPTLTPEAGGVLAEWVPVVAADLAGYRIYANGNNVFDYIEGGTSIFIPASADVEITLSAVDVSGNESAQSAATNAAPLTGNIPVVELTASSASGMRGDIISLTASGGDSYDWDTDGDGTWDITADTTGSAFAVTTDMGVIRPALRAHAAGDGFWMGAVSLIIGGNSRPVVSASVDVSSGVAPLSVNFTITAADDDGTIAEYAWDFEGDGIYEDTSPVNPSMVPFTYTAASLYNAKFRVTDNEGSWDVDTVAIQALPVPDNELPVIIYLDADPASGIPGTIVNFVGEAYDPDGTITAYEWDFENDDNFDSSEQNPTHQFDDEGYYNVKLRVTDDKEYSTVGYIGVNIETNPANQPPVAILMGGPTELYLGETGSELVNLDASESYDPEGGSLTFFFEPEGGVNWDCTADVPYYGAYYSASGAYLAKVMVEDDEGLYSPDSLLIHVYKFEKATVDSGGDVGRFTSLQVANGNPAICYRDNDAYDLEYIRATDDKGTSWGSPVTVDSAGDVGDYISMQIMVYGEPAISYYDSTNGDLKFVRSLNKEGVNWASPLTLDSTNDVGRHTSLQIVNGYPAISYYYYSGGDLKFIRATGEQGVGWGTPITIDSANDVGRFDSLAVVNGNPAISYFDDTNDDLKYVRANDANGATWGSPVTVDSANSVGAYTSLRVINGFPAISYYDSTNEDLKYVRAADISGAIWGSPVTVDNIGTVGWDTSLQVVDGNPAISYYDNTNHDLKFARALDANGIAWVSAITIDSAGWVGNYSSLQMVSGNAAVSYFDESNGDLNFAMARVY